MALLDVRKELSFCKKAEIDVLGLVENMCGLCCPACGQGIQLFPPNTVRPTIATVHFQTSSGFIEQADKLSMTITSIFMQCDRPALDRL